MTDLIKRHGAGGELSPAIGAMVDLQKYGQGWAAQRNMWTNRSGIPEDRPGFSYVASTKIPGNTSRLISWCYSAEQTYMLEFGDKYIRFHQNGAPILVSNVPAYSSTGVYAIGSLVSSGGVNYYCVLGTSGNAPPNATYWYPLTGNIYEIPSPYAYADLPLLKKFQSLDVMWLLHPSYRPANLNRFGQTNWTYTPLLFLPSQSSLTTDLGATAGAGGTQVNNYLVTTENLYTGEESLPGTTFNPGSTISKAVSSAYLGDDTQGHYTFITTSTAHGLTNGTVVQFNNPIKLASNPYIYIARSGTNYVATVLSATEFIVLAFEGNASGAGSVPGGTDVTYAGIATSNLITAINLTNPVQITAVGHGLSSGALVGISQTGITQLDNRTFVVTVVDANNVQLNGVDGTNYDVWPAPQTGIIAACSVSITSAVPTTTTPNKVTWVTPATQPSGQAVVYHIYGSLDGVVFGYLGSSYTETYYDVGLPIDFTNQPPIASYAFLSPNNFPSVGTIYQDRVVLAKTVNQPTGVWASQDGYYNNFGIPQTPTDSDAIQFNLQNDNGAVVQEFVEIGLLLIASDQSEYLIFGDPSGNFLPSAINPRKQAFNGFSTLKPLICNKNALFVQARGSQVRDLQLQTTFYTFIQGSDDLSQFAQHLLDGHTITAWDYQKIYNSIAWMVREDGMLLGLTYIKEQDIVAWHRHDSQNGFFEDVAVIAEGGEDMVYATVRRVINGQTVRFIERMNTRTISDLQDFKFADAMSTFDGRNTGTTTMTLSGGSQWLNTELLTLTASAPFFDGSDAGGLYGKGGGGNQIYLTGPDGTVLRFRIVNFTDTQHVQGRVQKTVPASMRNVALTTWSKAVGTLINMDYLDGQNVAVLGDGFELANPLDPKKPVLTVNNGVVVLPRPAAVIQVGLPIIRDLQTLNVDNPQGESISDKRMIFREVAIKVMASLGFFTGPAFPSSTDSNVTDGMIEAKVRTIEPLGSTTALQTQTIPVKIPGRWNSTGQICIRHIRMTPLSVLSVLFGGNLPEPDQGGK
jgi:hypothetical protein